MLRRFGLLVLLTAFMISACGRQVTPDRNNGASGLPSGYMEYKFRVAQPFNFQRYQYVIIFNTTGNGVTPLPFGTNTNFAGYSFAIRVYQSGTGVIADVGQYVRVTGQTYPTFISYPVPSQLLTLTTNTNGAQTEFTVTFAREIASSILGPQSPTPSPTPTPTPTATPTSSASPSPTASPTATPVPGLAAVWLANLFVTDTTANGVIVDSLGPGGPNDVSYQSPQYDTTTNFDVPIYVQAGNHASDPTAQIQQSEILNTP